MASLAAQIGPPPCLRMALRTKAPLATVDPTNGVEMAAPVSDGVGTAICLRSPRSKAPSARAKVSMLGVA